MVRVLIFGWFCVLFGLGFFCLFGFGCCFSFLKLEIITMILSFDFLIQIIDVPLSSLSVVFVANVPPPLTVAFGKYV